MGNAIGRLKAIVLQKLGEKPHEITILLISTKTLAKSLNQG